ncbi:hypothetical protein BJY01DRAFT_258975 [Aspergillus pseudoustus]|uniref:L-ornithine N(5)-monooxygenase n=1 Tax=Aspergillus pseudoustus TaxID=1810923 RepID=A0ABR4J6J3_9EURO
MLRSPDLATPTKPESGLELDAIIFGASWAGIWTLHQLKRFGLKVLLVDACEDVGGTWCYTRYPGCHVDTEIPLYEFSGPGLWKNWTWSKRFPDRKQIQRYLSWATDRLSLRQNLLMNTRVLAAEWHEKSASWSVEVSGGATYHTQSFILCTGCSTIPYFPSSMEPTSSNPVSMPLPGPKKKISNGKTNGSGVIGTAASGLQIIETLGPQVSHLTVFQRTPNLAIPMRQKDYTPDEMNKLKQRFYPDMLKQRNSQAPASSPQRMFQTLWHRGGLSFWFGNYSDLLTCRVANMEAYSFWRERVHSCVHGKATAERLAPTSYFGTFNLPHVELVDINGDPIQEITSAGVRTRTKFHDLDILVYATGFDALTGSGLAIDIRGVEGIKLETKWDTRADGNGVSKALGMMSAGFPNLFFPMGPQAPSAPGLNPQLAEIQGGWVANCIKHMGVHGFGRIEPTVDNEQEWGKEVHRAADSTLFAEADSWYMGVNIPGRKKQPLCYFRGVGRYAEHLEQAASAGYQGFTMSPTSGRTYL